MPFGARKRRLRLRRGRPLARAIKVVLTGLFVYWVSPCLGDCPQLEPPASASLGVCALGALKLLVWGVKLVEGRAPAFSGRRTALGIVFDWSAGHPGVIDVGNKPERGPRVTELVGSLVCASTPLTREAKAPWGLLDFTQAQAFGRRRALALHTGSRMAAGTIAQLSEAQRERLNFWPSFWEEAQLRSIDPLDKSLPVVLLTDGAEEGEFDDVVVGIGVVLRDPRDSRVEAFGGTPLQ